MRVLVWAPVALLGVILLFGSGFFFVLELHVALQGFKFNPVVMATSGVLLAGALVFFIYLKTLPARRMRNLAQACKSYFQEGTRAVLLTPDDVVVATEYHQYSKGVATSGSWETRIAWDLVTGISRTEEYAFIESLSWVVIVPKKGFPFEDHFVSFVEAAENLRKSFMLEKGKARPPEATETQKQETSIRLKRGVS